MSAQLDSLPVKEEGVHGFVQTLYPGPVNCIEPLLPPGSAVTVFQFQARELSCKEQKYGCIWEFRLSQAIPNIHEARP